MMAQIIARSGPRFLASAFFLLCGLISPATTAAVDTPSTAAPDSPLDGWGPYKFGMTADQVRSFAGPKWLMIPKPQWIQQPDSSFSLAASDEDQFGLHHVTVIEAFDAE